MEITKRIYKETVQCRSNVPTRDKYSSVNGSKWIPAIETRYEFCSVKEFIDTFTPQRMSEGLKYAIENAYNNCGSVTFNSGSGNKTFEFTLN